MSDPANSANKSVGLEVSNSAFKAVLLDAEGNIVSTSKVLTDRTQPLLEQLKSFINSLKEKFGNFEKIGVAVPGLVQRQTKRVAFSTYIPEHSEVDLLGELAAATGLKITIENDANAAAYGEFRLGAGRGSRNMFYATLGTGVGGAFIFDEKIWHGTSGFAGEFGYVAINSEGMKLEDVASAQNIIRRTRSRFHQDSTTSLSQFEEEQISLKDIINEAEKEDDFAKMMLQRTGVYVGTAVAGVINLLNIERVVVGGEIMEAKHLVLEAIIERAKELSFAPSFETVNIVEGELGENAAAVGAALLASENE
ncbi:MAG TPA: ROK family protein [Pyrinomonadaceae bacterium]|nr:ROK family protein [Pyrinomonadaceae bacterium]